MNELFLNNGNLIPANEWLSAIDDLSQYPLSKLPEQHLIRELGILITEAVAARANYGKKLAVLFSGGIDSTLIAFLLKKLNHDFVCITVGYQDGNARDPEDIVESVKVSKALGFRQEVLLLNLDQMDAIATKTAAILGHELSTVVNIGVGAVEVAAFEKGVDLGCDFFFGGLGSEEIYAGYDRHEKALATNMQALHDECIRGLQAMHARDLRRDCAIAAHCNASVGTPFLDPAVIRFSLQIPPQLKISASHTFEGREQGDTPAIKKYKKLILRKTAVHLGLPEHIAFRPKRAAQYGSRTNNALTALAKKHGFKHKDDYIKNLFSS